APVSLWVQSQAFPPSQGRVSAGLVLPRLRGTNSINAVLAEVQPLACSLQVNLLHLVFWPVVAPIAGAVEFLATGLGGLPRRKKVGLVAIQFLVSKIAPGRHVADDDFVDGG